MAASAAADTSRCAGAECAACASTDGAGPAACDSGKAGRVYNRPNGDITKFVSAELTTRILNVEVKSYKLFILDLHIDLSKFL